MGYCELVKRVFLPLRKGEREVVDDSAEGIAKPINHPQPLLSKEGSFSVSLLSLLHLRKRYSVEGSSMSPLLYDGDIVYTKKTHTVFVKNIVVLSHPFRNIYIIKQVAAVHGDMLELSGMNREESEDSSTFGFVPKSNVLGIVIAKN